VKRHRALIIVNLAQQGLLAMIMIKRRSGKGCRNLHKAATQVVEVWT